LSGKDYRLEYSVDVRIQCFIMTPFGCRVTRTSRALMCISTETRKNVTNPRGQSQNKQSGFERTCPTCVRLCHLILYTTADHIMINSRFPSVNLIPYIHATSSYILMKVTEGCRNVWKIVNLLASVNKPQKSYMQCKLYIHIYIYIYKCN